MLQYRTNAGERRKAPTAKDLCVKFMEDYSGHRNNPQYAARLPGQYIIPILGSINIQEVKRADVVAMMKKLGEAKKALTVLRKMFNLAET